MVLLPVSPSRMVQDNGPMCGPPAPSRMGRIPETSLVCLPVAANLRGISQPWKSADAQVCHQVFPADRPAAAAPSLCHGLLVAHTGGFGALSIHTRTFTTRQGFRRGFSSAARGTVLYRLTPALCHSLPLAGLHAAHERMPFCTPRRRSQAPNRPPDLMPAALRAPATASCWIQAPVPWWVARFN